MHSPQIYQAHSSLADMLLFPEHTMVSSYLGLINWRIFWVSNRSRAANVTRHAMLPQRISRLWEDLIII